MPALRNARHERFARAVVEGKSCVEAYVTAYGVERAVARSHASRLRGRKDVAGRIDEMLERAAAEAGVSAERVIREFALVAFSDMSDFAVFGEGGVSLKDAGALTAEQRRAVAEVTQSSTGVRIKLHSKLEALDKLARWLGLYAPQRHEHGGAGGGPIRAEFSLSEEDRERLDKLDAAGLARLYAEAVGAGG